MKKLLVTSHLQMTTMMTLASSLSALLVTLSSQRTRLRRHLRQATTTVLLPSWHPQFSRAQMRCQCQVLLWYTLLNRSHQRCQTWKALMTHLKKAMLLSPKWPPNPLPLLLT